LPPRLDVDASSRVDADRRPNAGGERATNATRRARVVLVDEGVVVGSSERGRDEGRVGGGRERERFNARDALLRTGV
jgi:hypothetical protein